MNRMLLPVLLAGLAPLCAQAEVRVLEVTGAPFKIVQATLAPAEGQIVFVLHNKSEATLVNPGLRGKVFAHGVRKGGFVYVFDATLEPGESVTLRRATKGLPIDDEDLVLVVASQASLRGATESKGGAAWAVNEQQYRALDPRAAEVPLAGLTSARGAAAPLPEMLGDCCERCLSDAGASCGNNYFAAGNSCRGRCIASYSCENERGGPEGGTTCNCTFSCKASEQCC